jgi:ribosomal-protein-alanine N-acetyltransferase
MNYFNHDSERLSYRKLKEDDVTSWLEFFKNNESLHYLGMDTSKSHLDLATEWIQKQIERYTESELGHLAVIEKSTDKLVGFSGIIARELEGLSYFEIGYSFKPTSWGKGYASEASQHLKKIGLELNISTKFVSIIHTENIPSMKVAEKNGMVPLFETKYTGIDVVVFGDK